jgi:hypothetical protein
MTNPNPIFQLIFSAEAEVTRAEDAPQDMGEEQ